MVHRPKSEAGETIITDRRRPGRAEYHNPFLIPLLRSRAPPDTEENAPAIIRYDPERDALPFGLRPYQGIVVGLGISVMIWAVILGAIWLLVP